jgi:hypothetical protein
VTGAGTGDPLTDLTEYIEEWFPIRVEPVTDLDSRRTGYEDAEITSDDDLLLRMVGNDTNGDDFLALWRGEISDYGEDHSRADLALCCHLAFWTNYDAERIDRMPLAAFGTLIDRPAATADRGVDKLDT